MLSTILKWLKSDSGRSRSRSFSTRRRRGFESLEAREVFAGSPVELVQTIDNPDTRERTNLRVGAAVAMNAQYTVVSVPGAVTNDPFIGFSNEPNLDRYTGRLLVYDTASGNLLRTIYSPRPIQSFFGEQMELHNNYLVVTRLDFSEVGHVYVYDVSTGLSVAPPNASFNLGYASDITTKTYPGSSLQHQDSPVAISGNYIAFVRTFNTTDVFGNPLTVNKLTVMDYINAPGVYIDMPDTADTPNKIALFGDYVTVISNQNARVYQISTQSLIRTWNNVNAVDVDFHNFDVVLSRPTANGGAGAITAYSIATGAELWSLAAPGGHPLNSFGSVTDIAGNTLITGNTIVAGYDLTNQQLLRTYTIPNGSRVSDISVFGAQFTVGLGVPDNQLFPALLFNVGSSTSTRSYTYTELASFGFFGSQVAMSDQYLAIQAPGDKPEISKIYIYDRASTTLLRTITTSVHKNTRMFLEGTVLFTTSGYDDQVQPFQVLSAYDITNGNLLYTLNFDHNYILYTEDVQAFATSPTKLAVLDLANFDGRIKIYDLMTGALLRSTTPNLDNFAAYNATFRGDIVYVTGVLAPAGSFGNGTARPRNVNALFAYNYATDTWSQISQQEGNAVEPIVGTEYPTSLTSTEPPAFFNFANQSIISNYAPPFNEPRRIQGQTIWNSYYFVGSSGLGNPQTPFAVDMFDLVTGEFIQRITPSVPTLYDQFGRTIAVDDQSIFIGAPTATGALIARGQTHEFRMPTVGILTENDADNNVVVGQQLVYTLKFTRGIQSGTLTAANFQNYGTAALSIDSIAETAPGSGEFLITVTPLTGGSVQLQLRDNTNLVDADGKALMLSATNIEPISANFTGANIEFLLSGRDLTITGTTGPIQIAIEGVGNGVLSISGVLVNGNPTTVQYRVDDLTLNGTALADVIRFNKADVTNLYIDLGDGNDQLFLGADAQPDITTTAGLNAAIAAGTLNIGKEFSLNAGGGDDQITMHRVFAQTTEAASKTARFDLGDGNDVLDAYWTNFGGSADYQLGSGDDYFSMGFQIVRYDTTIHGNDGHDLVAIFISALGENGLTNIHGDAGYDTLAVDTNYLNNIGIYGGTEDDVLVLAASTIREVRLEGNDGDDLIKLGRHYADDSTGGCVADDYFTIRVFGNAGSDHVILGNNSFYFMQLDTGTEDDLVEIIEYLLIRDASQSYLNGGSGTNRLTKVYAVNAPISNFI